MVERSVSGKRDYAAFLAGKGLIQRPLTSYQSQILAILTDPTTRTLSYSEIARRIGKIAASVRKTALVLRQRGLLPKARLDIERCDPRSIAATFGAAGQLTPFRRRLVETCNAFPEMSYQEIARVLGTTVATVNCTVFSIRERGITIVDRQRGDRA